MLSDGEVWGDNAKLSKSNKRSVNETILSPFYKKDKIQDTYNELKLTFKKQWGLEFRAYDRWNSLSFYQSTEEAIQYPK